MSSLDRLIKLAKKTGDRLIVHNPADGSDIVIMDIDDYETLFDEAKNDSAVSRDVRGLSERQLLNQINRDISIWRANEQLESEEDSDVPDFAESSSDWHSAGSIIEDADLGFDGDVHHEEPELSPLPEMIENQVEMENNAQISQKNEEKETGGLVSDDEPVFYEEPI